MQNSLKGPSFHLYEEFCSGHPEALDVIRKVQSLPEWDMFERRCAVVAADELSDERVKGTAPVHVRRHSTDDPKAARDLPRISKLTMRDFLIKPVQRICRYPLILQQLQSDNVPSSPTSSSRIYGENITSQALEAMKIVAAKVDEARRKTDIATKTRLIVERVSEEVNYLPPYFDFLCLPLRRNYLPFTQWGIVYWQGPWMLSIITKFMHRSPLLSRLNTLGRLFIWDGYSWSKFPRTRFTSLDTGFL